MLRKLVVGPYQSNCYILGSKSGMEGVVIDPGDEVFRIVNTISEIGLKIKYILITHGHIDHVGGAAELKRITQAPVLIHPADEPGLGFNADDYAIDGKVIQLGIYAIETLHTPGHSPGGVCYLSQGVVFSGDTLFAGSIGRTDFPGGDHNALIRGVQSKLFTLNDDIRVYPGHGPATSIKAERLSNPFFR